MISCITELVKAEKEYRKSEEERYYRPYGENRRKGNLRSSCINRPCKESKNTGNLMISCITELVKAVRNTGNLMITVLQNLSRQYKYTESDD